MPEPEGVLGEAPEAVYLVEVEEDLNDLPVQLKQATHLAVTTQTTLSQIDSVEDLTPALVLRQKGLPNCHKDAQVAKVWLNLIAEDWNIMISKL